MEKYPNYLIHYNKNHSSKNGQFVSGDGDGDGIVNDHAHRSEKKSGKSAHMSRKKARATRNAGISLIASSLGLQAVNVATSYSSIGEDWVHNIATGIVAAGIIVGTTQTIRGAVSMGKASRRGDLS